MIQEEIHLFIDNFKYFTFYSNHCSKHADVILERYLTMYSGGIQCSVGYLCSVLLKHDILKANQIVKML